MTQQEIDALQAENEELKRRNSIMHAALMRITDMSNCAWRNIPYWNANRKLKKLTLRFANDAYRAAVGLEPDEPNAR